MNTELTFEDFSQLAGVYALLGRLWLEELDAELLTALAEDDLKEAFENLGGTIPDDINEATVETLAVDYCQLLIGPGEHVSPVQSVWLNQKLQDEPSSSMVNYFTCLPGFEPSVNIPDHIGVQLQFMGELFQRAADEQDQELVNEIAEDFFEKHLSWPAPFFAAVSEKAQTEFYAGLANLTANFLNLSPEEY